MEKRRDYKFNRWRVCRKIASASTCEDGEKLLSTADGSRPGAEVRAPVVAAAVAAEISRICSVCSAAPLVSAFYLYFCPCCFFFFNGPISHFLIIGFFFYSTNQVARVKSGVPPRAPPAPLLLPSHKRIQFQIMNFLPSVMPQVYLFILLG
jgi:hypothetical protein